jgi:hypothetical protein
MFVQWQRQFSQRANHNACEWLSWHYEVTTRVIQYIDKRGKRYASVYWIHCWKTWWVIKRSFRVTEISCFYLLAHGKNAFECVSDAFDVHKTFKVSYGELDVKIYRTLQQRRSGWRSYVKRAVLIHSFAPSIEATPLLRILGYRMDIMLHDILYSNIQYAGDGYVFHNILLIRYTIIVVHVYCPRLYYWIESPANSYLDCMCVMFFEPIIKVIVHLNPILCSTTYNIMAVRTIQNFPSMIVALSTCTQTERLLP